MIVLNEYDQVIPKMIISYTYILMQDVHISATNNDSVIESLKITPKLQLHITPKLQLHITPKLQLHITIKPRTVARLPAARAHRPSKNQKQSDDDYFTPTHIAKQVLGEVNKLYHPSTWDLVLEPSAGDGKFCELFDECGYEESIAMDINPRGDMILEQNFLDYKPPPDKKHILTIGNPPYGTNSSTAIKFFNHASKFSDTIAFIVSPRFKNHTITQQLPMNFRMKHEINLGKVSFERPNGYTKKINSCFQIWEKCNELREKFKQVTQHPDWFWYPDAKCNYSIILDKKHAMPPPEDAEYAILHAGSKIGLTRIKRNSLGDWCHVGEKESFDIRNIPQTPRLHESSTKAPGGRKSWFWIKPTRMSVDELNERFGNLDYSSGNNTTHCERQSISKGSIVKLYTEKYGDGIN
jgi:predicted RNA methylase